MSQTPAPPLPAHTPGAPDAAPSRRARRLGDPIFRALSTGAGVTILVALALVALFLLYEGYPAFTADPSEIGDGGFLGYVGPLLFGTVYSAILALIFATPLSVGIALFITHYAPRRVATFLGYLIDLLAAVPSIVFGLWGITVFAIFVKPSYVWLEENLGFIPLFEGPAASSGRAMLTVGFVLAVMILPIMTAVAREAFRQTPRLHEEAALALGATRWEMIRTAVLPYGRGGVVSGAMLGLGRALGETLAIAVILSLNPAIWTFNLISTQNPSTIAANIALQFPEASGIEVNVLVATGLVLFVVTFAVNYIARAISSRGFSGSAGS